MGKKLRIRLLTAGLLASLVATISAAPSAGADTPSRVAAQQVTAAAATRHTLSQALAYLPGKKTSGPNSYTKEQWAVVTQMVQTRNSKGCLTGYYAPTLVLHDNRTIASPAAVDTAPVGDTAPSDVSAGPCPQLSPDGTQPNGTVQPNNPLNPFSWDWGHILGSTWSAIWDNCLSGATSNLVGSVGTSLTVNLLARGGRLFIGPEGYAAVAIGGCFATLLW